MDNLRLRVLHELSTPDFARSHPVTTGAVGGAAAVGAAYGGYKGYDHYLGVGSLSDKGKVIHDSLSDLKSGKHTLNRGETHQKEILVKHDDGTYTHIKSDGAPAKYNSDLHAAKELSASRTEAPETNTTSAVLNF
jgi:hypothetical protein